jgi:nucleoside-diphosphate-sugar epimerase
VSGEAEAEFDKGYRINLDGTRYLIDAIRAIGGGYRPRLVFTSSIAVFGAPFPDKIGDEFFHTPLTSYGTQKSICELLINDYTRKGLLDGISIRLPTICVRPGKPNKAASGFFSNIIREPLAGEEAVLPVSEDVRHWHASPKSAVGFLLHAGTMDLSTMGARRNLSMPGLSVTVGEQIAALDRVAGKNVTARIKRVADPVIVGIVSGWPRDFVADRALKLGFTTAEKTFDDIIRIHIEDELGGKFAAGDDFRPTRAGCGHDPSSVDRRMHDRVETGPGRPVFAWLWRRYAEHRRLSRPSRCRRRLRHGARGRSAQR